MLLSKWLILGTCLDPHPTFASAARNPRIVITFEADMNRSHSFLMAPSSSPG